MKKDMNCWKISVAQQEQQMGKYLFLVGFEVLVLPSLFPFFMVLMPLRVGHIYMGVWARGGAIVLDTRCVRPIVGTPIQHSRCRKRHLQGYKQTKRKTTLFFECMKEENHEYG